MEGASLSILSRIESQIFHAASRVWTNEKTANKIALNALEITNRTYRRNLSFFNAKTSKSLISGLFYLLGYRHEAVKTQKEVAKKLGTTEVTVRASYRKWLTEFPELFLDIIGKFAEDDSLRFFVLLQMKQKTHE